MFFLASNVDSFLGFQRDQSFCQIKHLYSHCVTTWFDVVHLWRSWNEEI